MKYRLMRMYLEPDGGQGGDGAGQPPQNQNQQPGNQQPPAFDYEKLANLVAGKQNVTAEICKGTVLRCIDQEQFTGEIPECTDYQASEDDSIWL